MGTQYIPLKHIIFAPIHKINQGNLWTIIHLLHAYIWLWVKINFLLILLFAYFQFAFSLLNIPKNLHLKFEKHKFIWRIHILCSKIIYCEFSIFRKKIENKRKKNIKNYKQREVHHRTDTHISAFHKKLVTFRFQYRILEVKPKQMALFVCIGKCFIEIITNKYTYKQYILYGIQSGVGYIHSIFELYQHLLFFHFIYLNAYIHK